MTIVHGVTQPQTKANLVPFAQNILAFLQALVSPQLNPTKDSIKNILGLIGDIASCIGPQIKDLLRQPFIERMILALQQDSDPQYQEIAHWTLQQIKVAAQ